MVTAMTSYANTSAAHHVAAAEIREMRKEVGKLRNLLGFKDEELQEAQEREENARRRSRREKQELMNEIYGLREQVKKKESEFDRASNLREVKLVYSTLGESFGARKNEINESKGAASKPIASTKSEKEVITESNDLRDRFKKLANLI